MRHCVPPARRSPCALWLSATRSVHPQPINSPFSPSRVPSLPTSHPLSQGPDSSAAFFPGTGQGCLMSPPTGNEQGPRLLLVTVSPGVPPSSTLLRPWQTLHKFLLSKNQYLTKFLGHLGCLFIFCKLNFWTNKGKRYCVTLEKTYRNNVTPRGPSKLIKPKMRGFGAWLASAVWEGMRGGGQRKALRLQLWL